MTLCKIYPYSYQNDFYITILPKTKRIRQMMHTNFVPLDIIIHDFIIGLIIYDFILVAPKIAPFNFGKALQKGGRVRVSCTASVGDLPIK